MSNSMETASSLATKAGPVTTGPDLAPTPIAKRGFSLPVPAGLFSVGPFIIFSVMFLLLPTLYLIGGAFFDAEGHLTLKNIIALGTPQILGAYAISLRVSAASAILGMLIGLGLALALIRGGLPSGVRAAVMTFSGVASNFAGVPLAFAFIATVGRLGLVTVVLKTVFGFDIYSAGFNLLSFWGLTLTYLYFQIPLMILIIAPAIDGLKKEWGEAAATLGATRWQFWRYIGLPVLWPNLLGTLSLLFANSFGAIATAYALTGSSLNIVPILLYAQIRGDVLHDQGLGAALALGMVLITGVANVIYLVFRARAERWLK
jgi:putative spermidine/putrescine transport system permease protein